VPIEEIKDFDAENTIYLSPDAEETLSDFDPNTNFIIGGIVDRSVNKNLTYEKAEMLGVRCRKLPLFEHLTNTTRLVLNINTVFEMLLRSLNNGQDWSDAITKAMPGRHHDK